MYELDVYKQFDWHRRQLSGHGESGLTWSSALSALTSIPKLDALTFLRWKDVIAQNGLRILSKGQFCPLCLAEDVSSGRSPYFRLAWEPCAVTVCLRHGVPLQTTCPTCHHDNVRHAAAFVVPGWCTKCGAFLGSHQHKPEQHVVKPESLWVARQVDELLGAQGQTGHVPQRQCLIDALNQIIEKMDGGRASTFASRVGIAKSTLHYWLQSEGTPTLDMSLKVASQCGLSLSKLLRGDLRGWIPPEPGQQLALGLTLPSAPRRAPARQLDWQDIEKQLRTFLERPEPITVLDAAELLEVEARQLYLNCNQTTRKLGERWKAHLDSRREAHVNKAWPYIEKVGRELLNEGRAITRREVAARVPKEILAPVPRLFDVLRDVQTQLVAEQYSEAVNDEH